ncbi:alkaline phosphatase-like [Physella acuta]|uniref:alkaline phosphatase-like n=1 Tax=Physella acuta TaxID=109671 RepID=UPI0027DC2035|nr:alkaline phosphatase-like [Physella acuta]
MPGPRQYSSDGYIAETCLPNLAVARRFEESISDVNMWTKVVVAVCLLGLAHSAFESNDQWRRQARADLERAKNVKQITSLAKNVVLMIGDGMGLPTVTAGRIYTGQKKGQTGEEYKFTFEQFPNVALSKTYNLDRQVPDSAGTASAIMTGVKVNLGTLGVDGSVPYGENCTEYRKDRHLKTILDYALEAGKSVGVVTTTRITHATPGSTYAHTPWRDWESDTDMKGIQGCEHLKDIAYQLVMDNPNINVLLGGGRRSFINNTTPDPGTKKISSNQRTDGLDLREAWKAEKRSRGVAHAYVENKAQFDAVDPLKTDYLFGLFTSSHMTYELERNPTEEPSLTEMVDKAIRILRKNPKGYFLLIEGGRIDHAHHDNYGKRALEETYELDNAVKKVGQMVSIQDTLTIVTADHSHAFGIAGYPTRGNNILSVVDDILKGEDPYDNLPYLTLNYFNGPAYGRTDLTNVDTKDNNFQQPGCVGMPYAAHGGEDVAIYAQGPMSHLFHTTHEQNYIGHVMMYASCIGEYKSSCDLKSRKRR